MKFAVYGTLKQGYGNHRRYLGAAQFIGKGWTEAKFDMAGGGFPYIFKNPDGKLVAVELYNVFSRETVRRLDQLEGNGRHYKRERVWCWQANGKRHRAWIYVAMPHTWRHCARAPYRTDRPVVSWPLFQDA